MHYSFDTSRPTFSIRANSASSTDGMTSWCVVAAEPRSQGRGSADPLILEVGVKAYISDASIIRDRLWRWSLRNTFSYLKRTKMQDFDQTFSKNFRGVTLDLCSGGHPLRNHPLYQSVLSDPQYFRRSAATGGVMVTALDLPLRGCGSNLRPFRCRR